MLRYFVELCVLGVWFFYDYCSEYSSDNVVYCVIVLKLGCLFDSLCVWCWQVECDVGSLFGLIIVEKDWIKELECENR